MSGGDELSMPEGDDIIISPQDILRRGTAGEYILKKKKNAKGSRVWEQFRIVFDPSNNDKVFGVACCCVCKHRFYTLTRDCVPSFLTPINTYTPHCT